MVGPMLRAVPTPTREAVAKVYWDAMTTEERARRLHSALKHVGMSQSDLMKRLGVSWPTVNDWARAKAKISWARWLSIVHACGLPPEWEPEGGDAPLPPPRTFGKKTKRRAAKRGRA
jgi:hypothetical protein